MLQIRLVKRMIRRSEAASVRVTRDKAHALNVIT